MASHDVLGQLFETNDERKENKDLLKKIILTTYFGRLRINNLSPDQKYSLADYMLDDENIIFDFTRLSHEKRKKFEHWLLRPHQENKGSAFLNQVRISEHRGYSAEVKLNWWGKFQSWLFNKRYDHWCLADVAITLSHQLTGLNICYGRKGMLVSFNQILPEPVGDKYSNPESHKQDSTGNAKRVYVTDQLVDKLANIAIEKCDFDDICSSPHPLAQSVCDYNSRFIKMHEHRKAEKFLAVKAWYKRLFNWFSSLFTGRKIKPVVESPDHQLDCLLETDKVGIYQRADNKEIVVVEKRPDLDIMVYCGGGAKIFAHVGVYKSFCEAGLKPSKYSGSSAGAIMALLSYVGYTADEIYDFFKTIRQENIVYYDINRKGISDTNSLKSALDFMVSKKVRQITGSDNLPAVFTFDVMEKLRLKYPGCGIGEQLFVTATKKREGTTKYFSHKHTPNTEVTAAVAASACLPVVFRPVILDGEALCDGGIKSNFPTEVFKGMDSSTLLESEHGNNLKLVGVQFDTGSERSAVDRVKDKVYRENIVLNWLYRVITGVNDPASGWEQDRIKLREHALQSIVIDIGDDVSSSNFNLSLELKDRLVQQGYMAGQEYIDARYSKTDSNHYENDELMYTTFASLSELLAYCCYRGNVEWFDKIHQLMENPDLSTCNNLLEEAAHLKKLYFSDSLATDTDYTPGFFGPRRAIIPQASAAQPKIMAFLSIYPVLHKLTHDLFKHKFDRDLFLKARHSISIKSPFSCLIHLENLKGEFNIAFHLVHRIIGQMKTAPQQHLYTLLKEINEHILTSKKIFEPYFFAKWDLSYSQCNRLLQLFKNKQWDEAKILCDYYKKGKEPLIVYKDLGDHLEDADSCVPAPGF